MPMTAMRLRARRRRPVKRKTEPIRLVRTLGGFQFATAYDERLAEGIGMGSEVNATVTKPRSLQQLRLFMALVRLVYDNQDHYDTFESLRFAITIRLGFVESITLHNGETHLRPLSLALDAMSGDEFNRIMDAFCRLICTEIIPALDRQGLNHIVKRAYDMIAVPPPKHTWGQGAGLQGHNESVQK